MENIKKYNRSYEDLIVWQKAIELAKNIYLITRHMPKEELYVLTSQLRRSSISVASNIAEGCARESRKEFIQFLSIASGSLAETKTQIIISLKIGLLSEKDYDNIVFMIDEVSRMLKALQRKIKGE